jgi:putative tryptophan/tyrosine transport system substrate-binding protein
MAIHIRRREFIVTLGGAAAAWPLAARATTRQDSKIPRVGVLWHAGSAEQEGPNFNALIEGFTALGYVDEKNIRLEHRFPNEIPDRFKSMAAELVASKVDVLVSVGATAAPYVKNATTTIPVVFSVVSDPVAAKLVDSLARPGGNVTGLTYFAEELAAKRLQFLKDGIPRLSRVGLLVNPNTYLSRPYIEESQVAAAKLGLALQTFEARSLDELEPAFDRMSATGMQAVSIIPEGVFYQGRAVIPKLALARRLPTCVWSRETLEPGALMSYGPDLLTILRRTAVYVDKILKGAKPGELPVEQPTRLQLFINLTTARALGLELPVTLLSNADEVIE